MHAVSRIVEPSSSWTAAGPVDMADRQRICASVGTFSESLLKALHKTNKITMINDERLATCRQLRAQMPCYANAHESETHSKIA